MNVEDAEEVVVGQRYLVNVVRTCDSNKPWSGWTPPVLPPVHEDTEIIRFPDRHYHVDWRFIDDDKYRYLMETQKFDFLSFKTPLLGLVILAQDVIFGPVRRSLECLRLPELFSEEIPWMEDLENEYADKRACKNICPHRGVSLKNGVADPTIPGSVVCSGHGLCFDRETGALRRRASSRIVENCDSILNPGYRPV